MRIMILFAWTIIVLALVACQNQGTHADATQTVPAAPVAKSPPAGSAELVGIWYVESIGKRPVLDYSPARLQFTDDGAVNGNASCNRFSGTYTYADKQLVIPQSLAATKMLCLPALMEQEQRFLAILPNAASAALENDLLTLRDAQGNRVIRASREEK